MKRSSGPRKTANLPESIHYQLNMYAIAAGAAGVGMLALAPPATARIVYTPAHVKIPPPQIGHPTIVPLDLNHDGVSDFYFSNTFFSSVPNLHAYLRVKPSKVGNRILGQGGSASALRAGVRVKFNDTTSSAVMGGWRAVHQSSTFFGQWANGGKGVRRRYLGLRFIINGKVHFGWARLNVRFNGRAFSGTLTGYAYETIPGKAIITGKTKGPHGNVERPNAALTAPTPEPATLGMLALGERGLSIWRREERE
jgi:hypothetical protein